MDLVGEHADAVPLGDACESLELLRRVHGAGRVVRVAQQVCRPLAPGRHLGERRVEHVEVEPCVGRQRCLDDTAPDRGDDVVEGVVDRGTDHDRAARIGEQPDEVRDAGEDVGDPHHVRRVGGPVPLRVRELGERGGIPLVAA